MAKGESSERDLAVEEKTSPLLGMLIDIGMGLLLVAVNVGITYFLMSMLLDNHSAQILQAQASVAADESGIVANKPANPEKPPIFIPLKPAFVVNLGALDQGRFLQAEIEVMTRNPDMEAAIDNLTPMIRNGIIMLLAHQSAESVSTRERMDALQQELLAEVNRILEINGSASGVEQVYFTSFVTQ